MTCNRLTDNSIGSNSPVAESYTYDARGNMIAGMNNLASMVYNEENRLEQVVDIYGITSYYQYDSGGQRVRKTTVDSSGGGYTKIRKYIGQWEVFIQQYTSTGVVSLERETLHVMDDKARVAMIDTPNTLPSGSLEVQLLRYQFGNHLGTATLELDDSGQIISYEEYHPYGTTSYQAMNATINAVAKRYRYTNKERDDETGLYYIGERYYAPWLARWCATDPINSEFYNHTHGQPGRNVERQYLELTASGYEYCYANPVRFTDPTGEQATPD